jgi:predicted aspartyl protease
MRLLLHDSLPFASIEISYRGKTLAVENILIDTGSATTILSADIVQGIDIIPEPNDTLYTIRGVGGSEVVFSRKIDAIKIGDKQIKSFEVEIGAMDYGFEINGILGMDFLIKTKALLNLHKSTIEFE